MYGLHAAINTEHDPVKTWKADRLANMKKYRLHLAIIVILTIISGYLLLTERKGSYNPSDLDFAIDDTSAIRTVEISTGARTLVLGREASSWKVNGIYPVRAERISGLMMLISRLEVSTPVSVSLVEQVRDCLFREGRLVTILLDDGSSKSYRVCSGKGPEEDTYMMLVQSDIPFIMEVRGYRNAGLEELYALETEYWRDHVILNFLPDEIEYISVEHRLDPGTSFHLQRNEAGTFDLAGGVLPETWLQPDPDNLAQYLQYFTRVGFEDYTDIQQLSEKAIRMGEESDHILKISSSKGGQILIRFYSIYTIDSKGIIMPDLNRLLARINDEEELLLVKYMEIDPVLKPFSYFRLVKDQTW